MNTTESTTICALVVRRICALTSRTYEGNGERNEIEF
jgi:hypothetical protein